MITGYHFDQTTNVMFGGLPAVAFNIIFDVQINATTPVRFLARHIGVALHSQYEVGKSHACKYIYEHKSPPVNLSYDATIATWQVAINRNSRDWGSRCELAGVYERKGDYWAMIVLWTEATSLEPDNTTVPQQSCQSLHVK